MTDVDPAPVPVGATRAAPLLLDGQGGAVELDWAGLSSAVPADRRLWIDVALPDAAAVARVSEATALEPLALAALLAEETRPRWLLSGKGLLLILRGVNFNPGADPDDMVSLRLWSEPGLLISTHLRNILAVREMRAALLEGRGPAGLRDLMVGLADNLVARVRPLVDGLADEVSDFEDRALDDRQDPELAAKIADLRRTTIRLRRHLAPQREVLSELGAARIDWMREHDHRRLRETADRLTRELELLETVREHALVAQDEFQNQTIQRTAQTSYQLTLIAALFLPLTFVTGLLGMNLGGIPGETSSVGFIVACAGLLLVLALEFLILAQLGWLQHAFGRREPTGRADDPR